MALTTPEYMRVRAYLYNLVVHSGGTERQIPPENELCRLFGLSRKTVRAAIKGLVQEKYLVPRRGMGTFINQDKTGSKTFDLPLIGSLLEEGRHVFDALDIAVGKAIAQAGCHAVPLYLPSVDAPDNLAQIVKTSMSGVVWSSPRLSESANNRGYAEALRANGIPLLLLEETPSPGYDLVVSTRRQRGLAIAEHMMARGHERVLFIHNDNGDAAKKLFAADSTYYGFQGRAMELGAEGLPSAEASLIPLLDFLSRLAKGWAPQREFTAIYSKELFVPSVTTELNRAGIAIPDDISYLSYGESDPAFFNGRKPDHMDTEASCRHAVVKWLKRRILEADRTGFFVENVDMSIVPGETVKNLKRRG